MSLALIIIICVVVLAIIGVLLALFYPVRYSFHADGTGREIQMNCIAKWLYGVVSGNFQIEEKDLLYVFRIFGIPFKKGRVEQVLSKMKPPPEEDEETENSKTTAIIEPEKPENANVELDEEEITVIELIKSIFAQAKDVQRKYTRIKEIMETKSGKRTWKYFKTKTKALGQVIKPDSVQGKLRYGLDDVALTAISFAFVANYVFRIAGEDVEVIPDFTEECFEWEIALEGKMPPWATTKAFSEIVTDEGVRKLYIVIGRIIDG